MVCRFTYEIGPMIPCCFIACKKGGPGMITSKDGRLNSLVGKAFLLGENFDQ